MMDTAGRRRFLGQAVALPWLASATIARAGVGDDRPAFPFVDGLSFLSPDDADVARSGVSAFICDVSSVERLPSDDGSVRYFRSFEACTRSLTEMRRRLLRGGLPGVDLALRGRDIRAAFDAGRTAMFLQFQGCEPVGDALWRLELFHELGLRVLQITHHNDNAWGGGAIEPTWTGLTKVGHEGVERMNALGLVPDLSHSSDPTALDVLARSRKPVVLSHGAARAIVRSARCAPDEVIRGVGRSGGVMGVFMMSMWLTPDPDPTVDAYVRQLRHVANVAGIEAVGIANDYTLAGELNAVKAGNDNAKVIENYFAWWDYVATQRVLGFDRRPAHAVIPELNNIRRLFLIEAALRRSRFSSTEIEKIMGGNWIRVLSESLG